MADWSTKSKPQKLTADELRELSGLDDRLLDQLAQWANKKLTCAHCKKCTWRCEVLNLPRLDIGMVEAEYDRIMALPEEEQVQAVWDLVGSRPEVFQALRRCCFCGFCTAQCQTHMTAPERMRDWRELFQRAGYMPAGDAALVKVDEQWHIFSAYRAVYGIEYPEFASLAWAAYSGPGVADTLFFPGCSLVSYAPELTRKVGNWLTSIGTKWALSDACCGSPLMSQGMFDRAQALREGILEQMRAAGITRMLTVCPGCGDEFRDLMGDEIDIVPLPEFILEHKDALLEARKSMEPTVTGSIPSVTFFDSCHDRTDGRHGVAIRALMDAILPDADKRELDHHQRDTLCCGAGGAVASYDPDVTSRRVWRVIAEGHKTRANTMITMCPTCAYTITQACLERPDKAIRNHHYLELLFEEPIDWKTVFDQLGSMWTGEYGAWLTQTFWS